MAQLNQCPFALKDELWPDIEFYDKQVEIIESVWHNDETYVPAGNMLGKDFVAGFIAIAFFLLHHPVRIITTSVADRHLIVLWAEINKFINNSKVPLVYKAGGNLIVNHREIKKVANGVVCPTSYILGMVAEDPEKMAGHHAPSTLAIVDEASGVIDAHYTQLDTWAGGGGYGYTRKRKLIIGNCNPSQNFWKRHVEAGDLLAES